MALFTAEGPMRDDVWMLEFYKRQHKRLKMNYYA